MSWSGLRRSVAAGIFTSMRPEEVLYDFDGPQIFTFYSKLGQLCLAFLCEEFEDFERFLVVPVRPSDVEALKSGGMTLRDALTRSWMWVVDRSFSEQIARIWSVTEQDLPAEALPLPGVLLQLRAPAAEASPPTNVTHLQQNLVLKPDASSARLELDAIAAALRGWHDFFIHAVESCLGVTPALVYQNACPNGYQGVQAGVLELSQQVTFSALPYERVSAFLERLSREIRLGPADPLQDVWYALLSALNEHRVALRVDTTLPANELFCVDLTSNTKRQLSRLMQSLPADGADKPQRVRIQSSDIPQADDLGRVFQVLRLMARRQEVNAASLGDITPRHVSYYKQAARVLGLLDADSLPTSAGQVFGTLTEAEQLRSCAMRFESSPCGAAWLQWSHKRILPELEPESAKQFLDECAVGLSDDTRQRRAQTLKAWCKELTPHHYGRG